MYISAETFQKHLSEYESQCGGRNIPSALAALWELYFAANPVDGGHIQREEQALHQRYPELSFHASNALTDALYRICAAYQRAAFLEGIQVGFHLAEELRDPDLLKTIQTP